MRRALPLLLALVACEDRAGARLNPDASRDAGAEVSVDAGPSGVGAPCSDAREPGEVSAGCRGGQYCLTAARGFPRGYCTVDCLQTPCPSDSYCVGDGATRYCLRACDDDATCRLAAGYTCARPSPYLPRGCIPDPSPVGRGADGGACVEGAALPRRAFVTPEESLSQARDDSDAEVNPSMAISPRDGTVTVAYLARTRHPDWFGGVSVLRAGDPLANWERAGDVVDMGFDSVVDPVIAFAPDGTLLAAYLAVTYDWPQPAVRVARSMDAGRSWARGTDVPPANRCAGGCETPSIAVGPRWDDRARWVACVAYVTRTTRGDAAVTVQCGDGARWSAPVEVGAVVRPVDAMGRPTIYVTEPRLPAVAVDADGVVHVAWLDVSRANARAALGDRHNGLRYARSEDGGAHFSTPERVAPEGEAIVGHAPAIAVVGGTVGVAWVQGEADGRWDVVLATRAEGGAWGARRVNDDATCATHGFVGMAGAAEDGAFHLVWIENRGGEGAVSYARCPRAEGRCGQNEAVSTARFRLVTSDDPARWHGVRSAVAVGPGGVIRAAWSDTRSGGPAIYSARGSICCAGDAGVSP